MLLLDSLGTRELSNASITAIDKIWNVEYRFGGVPLIRTQARFPIIIQVNF